MASKNVSKNREGYGYKYTDLAQIHNYLEKAELSYWQYIATEDGIDYVYTVPIIDGDELPPRRGCKVPQATLTGKSNPAQELGSALTYARRYSLLMAFGLATEDDDGAALTVKNDERRLNMIEGLRGLLAKKGIPESYIAEMWKLKDITDLTEKMVNSTTKNIDDALKKYKEATDGIS